MKSVYILLPYPVGLVPSQRFRVENYIPVLTDAKFKIYQSSFFCSNDWTSLKRKGNNLSKLWIFIKAWFTQFYRILKYRKVDYVFIHREIAPIGPPLLEWFIAKVLHKKIIYDFDDAIWTTDNNKESKLISFLRWRRKIGALCKWSYQVSAGNNYLAAFASRSNLSVKVNPTTVDADAVYNPNLYAKEGFKKTTLVWTGSSSTLKYLEQIEPTLKKLEHLFPTLCLLIISDQRPSLNLKNIEFKKWSKETEVADLAKGDIGIMPLPDDEWSKGKCGFKAIQYMALGIPCVASAVGVNTTIIHQAKNGYLCERDEDWLSSIELLLKSTDLKEKIGKNGRETVIENYSIASNASNFLSLFE